MFKSIRAQIALLAIVPLVAFMIASGLALNEAMIESRKASEILPTALISERSEAVLHELQKERGRTAVLMASGYAANPPELLDNQRKATDAAVAELQAAVVDFDISNEKLLERVRTTSAELDQITQHRAVSTRSRSKVRTIWLFTPARCAS